MTCNLLINRHKKIPLPRSNTMVHEFQKYPVLVLNQTCVQIVTIAFRSRARLWPSRETNKATAEVNNIFEAASFS